MVELVHTMPLCGVVVTFHPDHDAPDNLRAMVHECGRVIVVDNGSSSVEVEKIVTIPGIEVISLPQNIGLAAALNRGAERARTLGFAWIVTFDQDSRPQNGMVTALWDLHTRLPLAGVVGPIINQTGSDSTSAEIGRHPRVPWLFRRIREGAALEDVTMVVTSGSLMDVELWTELGRFDEALFIDYIDVDYCLKVIRAGRRVSVASSAVLHHRLGDRQSRKVMGREFRPMHHAAFRHYYMARNRVRIWRRHALAVPHWALFDFCFALYNGFRVLAFESERWRKVKAIAWGTWDGLRGRTGPCPADRQADF